MDSRQIKRVLNGLRVLDSPSEGSGTTIKVLYFYSKFYDTLNEEGIGKHAVVSQGTVRNRLQNISSALITVYELNNEYPPFVLNTKYPGITREVAELVLDEIGRDVPDWTKFPFEIPEVEPETPTPVAESESGPEESAEDVTPPPDGHEVTAHVVGETPNETPEDSPQPDSSDTTSSTQSPSVGINWRTFLTRRGVAILVLAVIGLFGSWLVFFRNPITGEPIDQPAEVVQTINEEEPQPTQDRSDFNTQVAQNVSDSNTAEAPTISARQTEEFQRAVVTAAEATRNASMTQTVEAIPQNTPTDVPTVTPSPTPSLTPSPSPPELLFMDDFEDVKADTYPSSTGWRNIYNGINAYVTTETSCEGNKSFRLDGKQNWGRKDVINIPVYDYVSYELCVRVEKPNSKARVGFNNPTIDEWGTFYADVSFSAEGFFVADGQNLMRYAVGQWHHILVVADFVNEKMNVYIDGELKGINLSTGPKKYTTFSLVMGNNFNTTGYFDNIRIYKLDQPPNLGN